MNNMYIRTKDEVLNVIEKKVAIFLDGFWYVCENHRSTEIHSDFVIKEADTLEELCDDFVLVEKMREATYYHKSSKFADFKSIAILNERYTLYGAIWTDKGLIYVSKMNENGELMLI